MLIMMVMIIGVNTCNPGTARLTLEVCGLGIPERVDGIIGLVDVVYGGDVHGKGGIGGGE